MVGPCVHSCPVALLALGFWFRACRRENPDRRDLFQMASSENSCSSEVGFAFGSWLLSGAGTALMRRSRDAAAKALGCVREAWRGGNVRLRPVLQDVSG